MQPTFLPWQGYISMIDQSDVFVFFDDVQYVKRSWHVRNNFKTRNGKDILTIQVDNKSKGMLNETLLNSNPVWRKKHLKTIQQYYAKALFFDELFPQLTAIYEADYALLSDFNIALIEWIVQFLGIETQLVRSSSLKAKGTRVGRLINICKEVHCTDYLSPVGSWGYIDDDNAFEASEIGLHYLNYNEVTYAQLHGEFIPFLSVLDIMMNRGKEALEYIRASIGEPYSHEAIRALNAEG